MVGLFVEKITQADFCYLDKDLGLLGESWWIDVVLYGETDEQGMIFDFGPAKKVIKAYIDETIDHKLLVPTDADGLKIMKDDSETAVYWSFAETYLRTKAPHSAFALLPMEYIDSEQVAHCLEEGLLAVMPETVKRIEVSCYQESIAGASYRYTHGLKKHQGNCQRIAHGHRSCIKIYENEQRCPEEEERYAKLLDAKHFYTVEDLKSRGKTHSIIAYCADQGEFMLEMPHNNLYNMEKDTTVENIVRHIFDKQMCLGGNGERHLEVRAFEGINKGAVMRST